VTQRLVDAGGDPRVGLAHVAVAAPDPVVGCPAHGPEVTRRGDGGGGLERYSRPVLEVPSGPEGGVHVGKSSAARAKAPQARAGRAGDRRRRRSQRPSVAEGERARRGRGAETPLQDEATGEPGGR